MNPNETLRLISYRLDDVETLADKITDDDVSATVGDLVSAVIDMDQWLRKGGSLPDAWQRESEK